MRNYSGVDTSAPVDGHAGATESSASTTHVAPSVTAAYANEMRVVGIADSSSGLCSTMSGWNLTSVASSGASKTGESHFYATTTLPAGPTGTVTATCGSDIGATHQLTLKPATGKTCNVTVQLSKPIRYRSSDSNAATSATSLTLNKPAGVVDGDVMVASISFILSGMTFPTIPAGWTQERLATNGGSGVGVFVKVASGEPASYTWGTSGASNMAGAISSYIGVDNTTPVDAENGGLVANFTSVTTVTPATMLVVSSFAGNISTTITFTPPAGMTERVDRANAAATFVTVEQADALWAPAAASGTRTAVPSNGTQPTAAETVALRPANALIGSATVNIVSPATASLVSTSFATSAVTFATGDFLQLDVYAPNDPVNCVATLSYDATATPSKLTVATIVPEGIVGLLLLAPALPFGARWWKRRRP
jgi:hypothetical protein